MTNLQLARQPTPLPGEKYYIPGSLLRATVNNADPLAYGMPATVDARVGRGRVALLGPEVAFRAQPHATFKMLFNALLYGAAESTRLNGALPRER